MTKVSLLSLRNGSEQHRAFAERAADLLGKIFGSEDFSRRIDGLCDSFSRGNGVGEEYVDTVRRWSAGGEAPDAILALDVGLAVDFPPMPGHRSSAGAPAGIDVVTPYWFIDDAIRRDDPASLAAQWIREWLIRRFGGVETPVVFSKRLVTSIHSDRNEFIVSAEFQRLIDFSLGVHDIVANCGKRIVCSDI